MRPPLYNCRTIIRAGGRGQGGFINLGYVKVLVRPEEVLWHSREALCAYDHVVYRPAGDVFGHRVSPLTNILFDGMQPGRLQHHRALGVEPLSAPHFFGHHARGPAGFADMAPLKRYQ